MFKIEELSRNKMYMVPDLSDKFSLDESMRKAKEIISLRQQKKNFSVQSRLLAGGMGSERKNLWNALNNINYDR